MPKAKLQQLTKTIGLLAYDIDKHKFVWPKSNKEYIELYMNLYQQQVPKKEAKLHKDLLKSKARLALAENYIAIYKFPAARKQYMKLLQANKLDEGYLGLAKVAYAEQLYYEVLLHTQYIETHSSASYLLIAKAHFELQQYDDVFEPLEKAFELDSYNEETLLLRAKFYEQLYRQVLQEPSYMIRAIASYQILFEKHVLHKLQHKEKLTYEPWHLELTKYITLLLEMEMVYEAIEWLTAYFHALPITDEKKLSEVLEQVFVLELKKPIYDFATQEQLIQLEKDLKIHWQYAYELQTSLLLELYAYAFLMNGELEPAVEQLKMAKKFRIVSSTATMLLNKLQGLRKIQRLDIQFHPDDYIVKFRKIENQFHYNCAQLVLPIVQNVLQHMQLTSLHAQPLSYKHIVTRTLYPIWHEDTFEDFIFIMQLEKFYQTRIKHWLRSGTTLNFQTLAQRPATISLLQNVESLFKQYKQPPQLLHDFLFESYRDILQQVLMKAVDEIFSGEMLHVGKMHYEIGTLAYYVEMNWQQQLLFLQQRLGLDELTHAIEQLLIMRTEPITLVRKQFYKAMQLLHQLLQQQKGYA